MGNGTSKAIKKLKLAEGDLVDIRTTESGWTVGELTEIRGNMVSVTTNEPTRLANGRRGMGQVYNLDMNHQAELLAPMGTHSHVGMASPPRPTQTPQHAPTSPSPPPTAPLDLMPGAAVDVLDYFTGDTTGRPMQQWFAATITEMAGDGSRLKVRFDAFPKPESDIWVEGAEFGARLAAPGSRSAGSKPAYLDEEAVPGAGGGGRGGAPSTPDGTFVVFDGATGSGSGAPPGDSPARPPTPLAPTSPAAFVREDPDTYTVGSWVDAKLPPPSDRWVLARIVAVRRDTGLVAVEVSYTGGPSFATTRPTLQETIVLTDDCSNMDVAGQHSSNPLHSWGVGQYVDVLDMYQDAYAPTGWSSTWRWGEVITTHFDSVRVRFADAAHRPDMWFDCGNPDIADRIRAHGSVTTAGESSVQRGRREADESFRAALTSAGFEVVKVANDNRCLFRAVAHQVYGDAERHEIVKNKLLTHMKAHPDVYGVLAAGQEGDSLEAYCTHMALATSWGGYPEQVATEEVFDRPVVVYSSDDFHARGHALEPSTIHFTGELPDAQLEGVAPILLSYHGGQHYNSLVATAAPASKRPPLGARDTTVILSARQARQGPSTAPAPSAPPTPVQESGVDLLAGLTPPPPSPLPGRGQLSTTVPPPGTPSTPSGVAAAASPLDLVRQRSRPSFDGATGTFTYRAALPKPGEGAGLPISPLAPPLPPAEEGDDDLLGLGAAPTHK